MAMRIASGRSIATAPSSRRIRFSRFFSGIWPDAKNRRRCGENFSTTKMIDKLAAKFGRKLWETPIGFKYICDRMLEGDILHRRRRKRRHRHEAASSGTRCDRECLAARRSDGLARQTSRGTGGACSTVNSASIITAAWISNCARAERESYRAIFRLEAYAPPRLAGDQTRRSRWHQDLSGRHRLGRCYAPRARRTCCASIPKRRRPKRPNQS